LRASNDLAGPLPTQALIRFEVPALDPQTPPARRKSRLLRRDAHMHTTEAWSTRGVKRRRRFFPVMARYRLFSN